MSSKPFPETPDALQPREIAGPGRTFHETAAIDALMDAVMELSAELWAVKDRQYVLERVIAQEGLSAAIEQWRPSPEDVAARAAMREAFTARVFYGFLRRAGGQTEGER
jgi:hypothetical protein